MLRGRKVLKEPATRRRSLSAVSHDRQTSYPIRKEEMANGSSTSRPKKDGRQRINEIGTCVGKGD